MALTPPPEPIGPYVTLIPSAESTFGIQAWTSFDTNELPAPVSSPAFGFACAEPVMLASVSATTAASTPNSVIVFLLKISSSPCLVLESTASSMPPPEGRMGRRKVKLWLQAGEGRPGVRDARLGLPFR